MTKTSKLSVGMKDLLKFMATPIFIIVSTLVIITAIKCLSNNIEGLNTNNEYIAYQSSNGAEVNKGDFKNGKWPFNGNGGGKGGGNCNGGNCNGGGGKGGGKGEGNGRFPDITAATNTWIDFVTSENVSDPAINPEAANEKRLDDIVDLFCLTKPNGEACEGSEDYCASLFGTVSNKLRRGRENIRNYFVYFANIPGLSARSVNEPIFTNQKLSDDIYLNSALITWTWDNGPGSGDMEPLVARMSFLYRKVQDKYCIIQLHSSAMPERADGIPVYVPGPDNSQMVQV